jgi:hypothetical protein
LSCFLEVAGYAPSPRLAAFFMVRSSVIDAECRISISLTAAAARKADFGRSGC